MRERITRLISNILNPFVVSIVIIILLAFRDTSSASEAFKWSAFALAISVVPVLVTVTWLVRRKKLDGFFDNTRRQRYIVYVIASALGAIDCGLMWGLKAPELLAVTFTVGFVELVISTSINHYWKISVHTAFIAGAVTILSLVYGVVALWTIILLPLVAWARIEMKQHTIAQVVTGAILAAGIVAGIYWGFGVFG